MRYLIAEDEPLLARRLVSLLEEVWPEASCLGVVSDGEQALARAADLNPQVVFLDVRMPKLDGLETALALCRHTPPPLIVFVSAHDEYAVSAFDAEAVDFLLKPVTRERMLRCTARLKERLQQAGPLSPAALIASLERLVTARASHDRLKFIRAGSGSSVQVVPVEDVDYFVALEKYIKVATVNGAELIIRMSLKELSQKLDPDIFWQVHRSVIVNARSVVSADRDSFSRISLKLRGRPESLPVSRQFAHLFRQM